MNRETNTTQRTIRGAGAAPAAYLPGFGPDEGNPIPVALSVYKRGHWVTVGKLVQLDGSVVLAVCHRHQHGVATTISIPGIVIDYAQKRGAEWLFFRRDSPGVEGMWRMPLRELLAVSYLGPGAGVERYVPVARMELVAWKAWAYAERVVRLANADEVARG